MRRVTAEKVVRVALEAKNKLDGHIMDSSYLDSSVEEHLLAVRDPIGYARNVDGVTIIQVQDDSIPLRYVWQDGELVNIAEGRF